MLRLLFLITWFLVIFSPLLAIGLHGFSAPSETFVFLKQNVLPDYVINSIALCFYTVLGACFIGIPTAWVVVRYQFFGRRFLEWMLLLPMAFPAYIVAYAYTDFLGNGYNIPIRSLGGAAFILVLCLYPYIYLFARTAFLKQIKSQNQIDAATVLGASKLEQFLKVILPNTRPFIMVGIALVVMEVLSDYGTVSYFNIKVFSTGIYNAWAGYGDAIAAARLSLVLLIFVLFIIFLEKKNRSAMRFFSGETESVTGKPSERCRGLKSAMLFIICMVPIILGFILPFGLLINLMMDGFVNGGFLQSLQSLLPLLKNTMTLAFGVSAVTVILAYIFCAIQRRNSNKYAKIIFSMSGFGYALPGVVLGLGLLILAGWLRGFIPFIASGTLLFLVMGYMIRFWTIPTQSIEAGFEKISPNIDHASALMRNNRLMEFWYIRLPLLWPAILSGSLILSVEIIKELPLTLILRPFDYNTLAIQAYHLASDERLSEAALPSIIIALCGLIPVLILSRLIRRG